MHHYLTWKLFEITPVDTLDPVPMVILDELVAWGIYL